MLAQLNRARDLLAQDPGRAPGEQLALQRELVEKQLALLSGWSLPELSRDEMRRRLSADGELVSGANLCGSACWPGLLALTREVVGRHLPARQLGEVAALDIENWIARLALRPLAAQLAGQWQRAGEPWSGTRCPVCGAEACFGRLDGEGRKSLGCASCTAEWGTLRLRCAFCGEEDSGQLDCLLFDDHLPYSVDLCRSCGRHLKILDERRLPEAERGGKRALWAEDLITLFLDLAAQRAVDPHAEERERAGASA